MTAIKRLALKDFRNHRQTEIALDKINLFIGSNGAGKTSIQAAIEYGLTGRCRFTNKKGEGVDLLVRRGSKKASVTMEFSEIGALTREVPNSLRVADWAGNTTAQHNHLMMSMGMGMDSDLISAALNTSDFISRPGADQLALIFSLSHTRVTAQKVFELLESAGIRDDGMVLASLVPEDLSGGPEVFDKLDAQAREARKAAKKRLADLEGQVKAFRVPQLPGGVAPADAPEVEHQLVGLKSQRDSLLQQKGQADGSDRQRQTLAAEIDQLKADIMRWERQGKENQAPPANLKTLEGHLAEYEAALAMVSGDRQQLREAIAETRGTVRSLEQSIEAFRAAEQCPMAPVPCDKQETVVPQLEEQLTGGRAGLASLEATLQKADKEAAGLADQVAKAQTTIAKLKALEEAREEVRVLRARLNLKEGQLAEMPTAAETGAIDQALAETTERIARGEQILRTVQEHTRAQSSLGLLNHQVSDAQAEVDILERLVEAFGPKGIRVNLVAEILLPIEAKANERLEAMTDGAYRLAFSHEDGFEIMVGLNGARVPVRALSDSEQFRVGVVMQLALNDLHRLGIIVFDRVECCDSDGRAGLVQALMTFADDFDTAVVLAVKGDIEIRDPGIPGLAMFSVEAGEVRRVGQEVAASA